MQLGGNSLAAGAVCSKIRAALQTEHHIPVAWLMQCPTIRTLARRLADQGAAQDMLQIQPLRPTLSLSTDPHSSAPLTFQQVMALHCRFHCLNYWLVHPQSVWAVVWLVYAQVADRL
jgi:Phosphopantetheine attachment site